MKLIITFLLLFSTSVVFGQNLNEQFFKAVSDHDSTQVELLLNKGADVNFKKKLMTEELSPLVLAVLHGDVKIVKLLVDHKVEVDWRDWFKTTALMYAANSGNITIVKLLLAAGADPNAHDDQGNSVLSAAKESKNEAVIKLIAGLQKI